MHTHSRPTDTSATKSGIYRVQDPSEILVMIGFSLGTFFLSMHHNYVALSTYDLKYFVDHLLFNIFPVIFLCRLKAILSGTEVDLGNRTMEFAGGGIVANNPLDYVRPKFFLQYFKRSKISLDEITSISQELYRKETWVGAKKDQLKVKTRYLIHIVGSFGMVSLSFRSEGKRDELYNLIRIQNRMGTPVFLTT